MLRFLGKHGRRKVVVPNLINLSKTAARSTLQALGLTYSETSSNTENSSINDLVQSQGVAEGTTVLYGDQVSYTYAVYVAPPYFPYFPYFAPPYFPYFPYFAPPFFPYFPYFAPPPCPCTPSSWEEISPDCCGSGCSGNWVDVYTTNCDCSTTWSSYCNA